MKIENINPGSSGVLFFIATKARRQQDAQRFYSLRCIFFAFSAYSAVNFFEPQRHNRHKGCTKVLLNFFIDTKARRQQDAQRFYSLRCIFFAFAVYSAVIFLNHKGTIDTKIAQRFLLNCFIATKARRKQDAQNFILCVVFSLRSPRTRRLFFFEPQRNNRHKGCTKVLLNFFIDTKARRQEATLSKRRKFF